MQNKIAFIFSAIFLIINFSIGSFIVINSYYPLATTILYDTIELKEMETICNDALRQNNNVALNIYGLIQRIIGKNEVKGFQVFRDNENNLYLDQNYTGYSAEDINRLYQHCENEDTTFLFTQVPYKNPQQISELNGYTTSQIETQQDELLFKLDNLQVPNMDLRDFDDCKDWYKTDHHWSVDAAFSSAKFIVERLNHSNNLTIKTSPYSDLTQYSMLEYKDSFLGSAGIRIGEWYVGKEDFKVIVPTFETDFSFDLINSNNETTNYSGSFTDAFINMDILENKEYFNKYNSLLYGGWYENIVINNNADNDLKILFITHSYGRAIVPYLSLYFKETRYIDVQEGRFSHSLVSYINSYSPDIVVLMYNGKINVSSEDI